MSVRTLCWTPWTKLWTASIVTEEAGAPGFLIHAHADPGGARPSRPPVACGFTIGSRTRAAGIAHRVARCRTGYHFGQAAVYKSADKAVEYAARAADRHGVGCSSTRRTEYDVALRAMDFATECGCARKTQRTVRQTRAQLRGGRVGRRENAFEAAASLLGPAEHEKRELLVRLA